MNPAEPRIVLHDSMSFMGGGERLARILAEDLPADLALGDWSDGSYSLDGFKGRVYNLKARSSVPLWRTLNRLDAFLRRTRFLRDYETVVYSGIDSPLAVVNHRSGKNIFYCHTPPRAWYDLKENYLARMDLLQRVAHHVYQFLFQSRYEQAVKSMDRVAVNSMNVQNRVREHLGRESTVIYPPCETEKFKWLGQEDYYLSTARLDWTKRVDRIVEAFRRLPDRKLVVTSSGPELSRLKRLADGCGNIRFTGPVSDLELTRWIGNAIMTIYIPIDEDFGMSPVESMSAGKPVIGVNEGGLRETVIDGRTGRLLKPDPPVEEVMEAIEASGPKSAWEMRKDCEEQAKKFSRANFVEQMRKFLQ